MKEKIYIDLDGVLANFSLGVQRLGFNLEKIMKDNDSKKRGILWATIRKNPYFWAELELLDDAMVLWNYFKDKDSYILTGIPSKFGKDDFEKVKNAKTEWIKKNLSIDENRIICCITTKKPLYIIPNHKNILIDDHTKNISNWLNFGGIGILHKNSKKTIDVYQTI